MPPSINNLNGIHVDYVVRVGMHGERGNGMHLDLPVTIGQQEGKQGRILIKKELKTYIVLF